ncbi:MAG: hypothetical protein M1822_003984 [Bathelium mastoideum]|nr:MAG: hypothetical protein M1822_003984 [Bathelium mastoideum]
MTSPSKSIDIAIVGGGIAGLMLAIGLLKKPNIKVTIYEAAHHFGEIGAGVALGPNAQRAMELIDPKIMDAFKRLATGNLWKSKEHNYFEYRDDHGEPFGTTVNTGGQSMVYRADLLDELVKLVPQDIAHFAKRVVHLEDLGAKGVLLKFKDGSEATHDCVVGCDGIKSEVRHYLFGDSPVARAHFSGKYCHRGLIPMDKAVAGIGEELAMNNQMYLGKHGHVLTFPVQNGKTMNVVAFASKESWDDPNWVVPSDKEHLLADFKDFGPVVQRLVGLMENNDIWALFDMHDHPLPIYYKGRVSVSGDAAHATTPHQGSGAAMATEDGYILSELLGTVSDAAGIEKAFKAYDEVRRARTQKLVATSREAGHLWELEKYGGDLQSLVEDMKARFAWIWDEDLEAEVAEGKRYMNE